MKSYKENWKKLIGIGVVALAALLVLIGIEMVYHEKVKRDAGKGDQILIENFGETLSGEYSTEELMEMAIADRVDGIIVQVSDEEAVSTQIDKAEEQNIPVITIRSDAPVSKRVSSVLYRLCKHGTSCSRYLRCRI